MTSISGKGTGSRIEKDILVEVYLVLCSFIYKKCYFHCVPICYLQCSTSMYTCTALCFLTLAHGRQVDRPWYPFNVLQFTIPIDRGKGLDILSAVYYISQSIYILRDLCCRQKFRVAEPLIWDFIHLMGVRDMICECVMFLCFSLLVTSLCNLLVEEYNVTHSA